MNTEDPKFQDALHNLTTAFYNFLDVVNPCGADRAGEIRYIAQTLQNLAAHMSTTGNGMTQGYNVDVNETQKPDISQHVEQIQPNTQQPIYSNQPATTPQKPTGDPNLFRDQPFFDEEETKKYGFIRLSPNDAPNQYFKFYIDLKKGEGFYKLEVPGSESQAVYESRENILIPQVVEYEGEVTANSRYDFVDYGMVKRSEINSRAWIITKPCKVKITAM
ncbi:MAG: hypothetical protein J6X58_03095 [Bacteroidales bacterium]|nr:hypothetical protein [Bacteroidales bacterium]